MDYDHIDDDEIIYRRIPRSSPWFENNSVTSASFGLDRRRGERGLSVYRKRVVSAHDVLAKPDAIPGSLIAEARVGAIRGLANGKCEPLHLDVVAADDEHNPGHAEIRGPQVGKLTPAGSNALKRTFTLVET